MNIVEDLLCRGDPTEQDLLQQGSGAYTGSPFGVSFCRQLGDAAAQSDYPALRTSGRGPPQSKFSSSLALPGATWLVPQSSLQMATACSAYGWASRIQVVNRGQVPQLLHK